LTGTLKAAMKFGTTLKLTDELLYLTILEETSLKVRFVLLSLKPA